jgi:hypothetical protein
MILAHRCKCCFHPDFFHEKASCSYGACPCRQPVYGDEPELLPSFVWGDGIHVLDEELKTPGTLLGAQANAARLCNCRRCRQLADGYAA